MSRVAQWMPLLAIVAVIGGGFCLFFGWRASHVFNNGTPEPQRVALAAMTNPPTNLHLTVTDFDWGGGFVTKEDKGGSWDRVWIPLVPPGFRPGAPAGNAPYVPVVVDLGKVKSQGELEVIAATRKEVTGVVTSGWYSLDSDVATKLANGNPAADYSKAVILDPDYEFPTSDRPGFLLASGAGLVLLALVFGGVYLRFGQGRPQFN